MANILKKPQHQTFQSKILKSLYFNDEWISIHPPINPPVAPSVPSSGTDILVSNAPGSLFQWLLGQKGLLSVGIALYSFQHEQTCCQDPPEIIAQIKQMKY